MIKRMIALFVVLTIFSCSAQQQPTAQHQKKIVFIPGHDSHGIGEHEHLGGCTLLAKLINEHVPGVHAVVTEQGWPKDTTILNDADAIVMYSDGGEGHMVIPHMAHVARLMDKGVGLVNLHYAVEIPKGEGAENFLKWVGGYFETDYSVNPIWTAKFSHFPKHPITRGVKPFEIEDEWYYHMRFVHDKNLVPILVDLPPASSLERPEGPHENNPYVREDVLKKKIPQTMAWAYVRPNGGRGFGFTGAHVHNNWMNDSFRKLVLNAIVWTAKVDVPADGVETPAPTQAELDSLRKTEK